MAWPIYESPSITKIEIVSNHRERPGRSKTWWVAIFFQWIIKACGREKVLAWYSIQNGRNWVFSKYKIEEVCFGHGVKNLWSNYVDANFHLTITTCVSYNGFFLTPIFVVPSQQLNQYSMDLFHNWSKRHLCCPEGIHELQNIYEMVGTLW